MSYSTVQGLRKAYNSLEKVQREYADDSFMISVCIDALQEKINRVEDALLKGVNQSELTPKEIGAYRMLISFALTPEVACRYILSSVEKPNMIFVKNIYEFYELNKYEYYKDTNNKEETTTSNLTVEGLRKAYNSLEKIHQCDYADNNFVIQVCVDALQEKINRVDAALLKGVNQSELTPKEIGAYQMLISFALTPEVACRYILLSVEKPNITLVKNIYEFYEMK